jgi:hypothetical protein
MATVATCEHPRTSLKTEEEEENLMSRWPIAKKEKEKRQRRG